MTTCAEVRDKILRGEPLEGAEVRAHLQACAACAALAEDAALCAALGAAQPDPADAAPPPALLAALQGELAQEASWRGRLRSLSTPMRAALAAGALLTVALSGLLAPRPDLGLYPAARLALELSALGILALAGIWAWLRPLHRPAWPGWVCALLLCAALALPWVLALLPPDHVDLPAAAGAGDGAFIRRAAACFLHGAALALPAALLTALLGRGGRSSLSLALLPAVAGALGGLIGLQLHCPNTAVSHLLAGHAPIAAALALAALVIHLVRRRRR